jgi:hypothetical protein
MTATASDRTVQRVAGGDSPAVPTRIADDGFDAALDDFAAAYRT